MVCRLEKSMNITDCQDTQCDFRIMRSGKKIRFQTSKSEEENEDQPGGGILLSSCGYHINISPYMWGLFIPPHCRFSPYCRLSQARRWLCRSRGRWTGLWGMSAPVLPWPYPHWQRPVTAIVLGGLASSLANPRTEWEGLVNWVNRKMLTW